ncbi:MAG: hypothetical protein H5T97_11340 [Firmicutes bacterium]|nr:hypothetical protein [Bacillota bacterium]
MSGVDGEIATFNPGEEKSFTFNFTGQNRDSVLVAKIRPVEGNDANWNDNSRRVVVPLKPPEPPPGGGGNGLTFRAVSQTRSKTRPAGTAKWTDWVTATFEPPKIDTVVREGERPDYGKVVAPPPPEEKGFTSECGGADYSVLRSWRIVSAKLTYPRQNPDFTMGCPYPPLCGTSVLSGGRVITDPKKTVTKTMEPVEGGHKVRAEFQEMWALDGAPVYCLLEGRVMAENPQYYTLAVHDVAVEVEYEIVHHYVVCDEFGCWCEMGVYGPYTYRYTMKGPFAGRLLVNGTGVDSRAQ